MPAHSDRRDLEYLLRAGYPAEQLEALYLLLDEAAPEELGTILAETLVETQLDEEVRLIALGKLAESGSLTRELSLDILRHDPSASIRERALSHLLFVAPPGDPELLAARRRLADRDPEPRLRRLARRGA